MRAVLRHAETKHVNDGIVWPQQFAWLETILLFKYTLLNNALTARAVFPPAPPANGWYPPHFCAVWFGIWVCLESRPRCAVVWFGVWVALGVSRLSSSSSSLCSFLDLTATGSRLHRNAILVTDASSILPWHSPWWKVSSVPKSRCVWDEILVTVGGYLLPPCGKKCARSIRHIWTWARREAYMASGRPHHSCPSFVSVQGVLLAHYNSTSPSSRKPALKNTKSIIDYRIV